MTPRAALSALALALAMALPGRGIAQSTPALVGGGLLAGAAGAAAGGVIGALVTGDDGEDLDFLAGAAVGVAVGEGLGLPLGVHLAAGRRGSYTKAALVSLALAGAGLVALQATHWEAPAAPAIVIAVPVGQLVASIRNERGAVGREP